MSVEPLDHHAPRPQPRARERVELAREEIADAGHPDVGRVGEDDVVRLLAREKRIPPVGDEERHPRVREDVPVLRGEVLRRLPRPRLDVRDLDRPDGIARDRGGRDAGAEAEHEDVLRVGVGEHRQVSEQELIRHVSGICRGVRLAVRAVEAVRPLAVDGEGGRDAVLVEQELRPLFGVLEPPDRFIDRGVEARSLREAIERPRRQKQREDEGRGRRGHAEAAEEGRGFLPEDEDRRERRRRRGDRQRRAQPEARHEHEAREKSAADRADGVPERDPPDAAAHALEVRDRRDRRREGDAERDRERQQQGRRLEELPELDQPEGVARRGKAAHVEDRQPGHRGDAEQGGEGGCAQGDPEHAPRSRAADPREDGAADRHPDQKLQEHEAERIDRAPEDEREEPRPRDFVDHAGEARKGRGREHETGSRGSGGGSAVRGPGRHRRCEGSPGRRRRARRSSHRERDQAGEEVHRDGDELALAHADARQKKVRRRAGSDGGAQRVGGVERTHARSDLVLAPDQPPGEDGERPAHQHARQHEHESDQQELHHEEDHRQAFEARSDAEVDGFDGLQEKRDGEGEGADRDLEKAVGSEGSLPMPVRPAAQKVASGGEPSHERGQDRRHGQRRGAEDVGQTSRPEDLVDEPARAGKREDREQRGALPEDRSRAPEHWPKDGGSAGVFQDFEQAPPPHLRGEGSGHVRTDPAALRLSAQALLIDFQRFS